MPTAVADLPGGGPSDRGLPLDSGIPGSSTYTKPLDDTRTPNNEDESIYRVDDADDLTKDRSRVDVNEDNANSGASFNEGIGDSGATNKTTYPYRDGVPNAHNASFVAELWKLEGARTKIVNASSGIKVMDLRSAATSDQILAGLDPTFKQRAKKCSSTLKRADIGNLRWIFSVDCGNGPKAVKVKAIRKGSTVQFGKLDLEMSCSCPAWQWLGPEFHAKSESYQLGPLAGTASTPDIKDPERDNRVCKHVAAVLTATRGWEVPNPKARKVVKKAMKTIKAVKTALKKKST